MGLDERGVGRDAACACLRLGAGVVEGVVRKVRVVEIELAVLAEGGGGSLSGVCCRSGSTKDPSAKRSQHAHQNGIGYRTISDLRCPTKGEGTAGESW